MVTRDFVVWLHEQHITLATTSQHHVDRWLSDGPTRRRQIKGFLHWTSQTKLTAPLHAAGHLNQRQGAELADDERLGLIVRLLHDNDLELRTRVAGGLIFLYGQPLTRVTCIRVEHIDLHNGHTSITLGRDKLTLPAPIGRLVEKLADAPEGSTLHDPNGGGWLFPGEMVGAPITPERLCDEASSSNSAHSRSDPDVTAPSRPCSERPLRPSSPISWASAKTAPIDGHGSPDSTTPTTSPHGEALSHRPETPLSTRRDRGASRCTHNDKYDHLQHHTLTGSDRSPSRGRGTRVVAPRHRSHRSSRVAARTVQRGHARHHV